MIDIYYYIIINFGVFIAAIASFVLLFLKIKQNSIQKGAFILLSLTSLISLEFYSYQMHSFPLSIIIPIGIIILFIIKITKEEYPILVSTLVTIFSLYLILGLGFLSSSANTWGLGPAPNGIFIVSNSIIILITLFSMQQKYFNVFIICQILIALGGFTVIYYSTSGFYYGSFDGQDVRLRRISSIFVCLIFLLNCILILKHKNHLLTKNIVHLADSTKIEDDGDK